MAELYYATGYNDLNWMRSVWFSPSDDDADGGSRHESPRMPRSARASTLEVRKGKRLTLWAAWRKASSPPGDSKTKSTRGRRPSWSRSAQPLRKYRGRTSGGWRRA